MRFSDLFDCFESATPWEHANVVLMPGEKPVFSRKRPKKEDNEQERESQRLDIREASAKTNEVEPKQQSIRSSREGNENVRYSTDNCRVLKASFKRQFSNKGKKQLSDFRVVYHFKLNAYLFRIK